MSETPTVSVVVPTFNERESFAHLHPRLTAALNGFPSEVLVVDDNSPDGTAEFVRSLTPAGQFQLIARPRRTGLASAVLEGIERSSGDVVVVMDADGSHPPETIPSLVEPLVAGRAEFVLASRRAPGGSAPGLSEGRQVISWGARMLARPLIKISDPMSGFFAFRRPILARAPLDPIGYKIALEILVRCRPSPVEEVPFVFAARLAGESKLNGSQVRAYVRHLGRLYRWRVSAPGRAASTR